MSKEIMQQALDALLTCDVDYDYDENPYNTFDAEDVSEAIDALRQALAQPDETETLKRCLFQMQEAAKALAQPEHPLDKKADNARELGLDYEPEQEPVAWLYKCGGDIQINTLPSECYGDNWTRTPLYTAPPKREWVGLTDDELNNISEYGNTDWTKRKSLARAIEAKLREKNG